MSPDALATLARRRAVSPTYDVIRSGHPIWRWWVFLACFGETIDSAECITRRGAERVGRAWVEGMSR